MGGSCWGGTKATLLTKNMEGSHAELPLGGTLEGSVLRVGAPGPTEGRVCVGGSSLPRHRSWFFISLPFRSGPCRPHCPGPVGTALPSSLLSLGWTCPSNLCLPGPLWPEGGSRGGCSAPAGWRALCCSEDHRGRGLGHSASPAAWTPVKRAKAPGKAGLEDREAQRPEPAQHPALPVPGADVCHLQAQPKVSQGLPENSSVSALRRPDPGTGFTTH